MAKKRDKRKPETKTRSAGGGATGQWVAVALVAGLVLGGVIGYYVGSAVTQAGITDAFGRSPGHPHYNHDHN